jgi:hypothetical protein
MGWSFLATSIIVLSTAGQPLAHERSAVRPAHAVPLRLVVHGLGRGSIELLRQEVEAIWSAQGVKIVWTAADAGSAVLVLVDQPESALPPSPADGQWHVAATRVVGGRIVPDMYVSLDAAARVVHSTSPPYSSPALAGIIVPRVAARAIAHELAHILLDTRIHTRRGLLRARISASDFVFPGRDPFMLESSQIEAVHRRLEIAPLGARIRP